MSRTNELRKLAVRMRGVHHKVKELREVAYGLELNHVAAGLSRLAEELGGWRLTVAITADKERDKRGRRSATEH